MSALDAKVRVRLRHEVKQLQAKLGVTTIMVTHDQEEALTMADRIVVMDQGTIVQVGTPLDIYRRPTSPFVADFVGTMNFLAGSYAGDNKVRIGGVELSTAECDGFDDGARVTICIRPEDVTVRQIDAGTANAIETIVADLEFLGSFYRAGLALKDDPKTLIVADFSINLVRDVGVEVGRPLTVAFPEDRIRVFPGG